MTDWVLLFEPKVRYLIQHVSLSLSLFLQAVYNYTLFCRLSHLLSNKKQDDL